MKPIFRTMQPTVALCVLLGLGLPVATLAADATGEHDQHQASAPSSSHPDTAAMTAAMQKMQSMHEEMMAAKTPAERQALMADHMKAMQEGMAMMQQMRSGKTTMSPRMMQMRMDMMTMMMQMMMDRQQMMGGMGMGGMMGSSPGRAQTPSTPKP